MQVQMRQCTQQRVSNTVESARSTACLVLLGQMLRVDQHAAGLAQRHLDLCGPGNTLTSILRLSGMRGPPVRKTSLVDRSHVAVAHCTISSEGSAARRRRFRAQFCMEGVQDPRERCEAGNVPAGGPLRWWLQGDSGATAPRQSSGATSCRLHPRHRSLSKRLTHAVQG